MTTYLEMAVPPSHAGVIQLTVSLVIPTGDAATPVGGEGTVMGGKLGSPPAGADQLLVMGGPSWITPAAFVESGEPTSPRAKRLTSSASNEQGRRWSGNHREHPRNRRLRTHGEQQLGS